MWFLLLGFLGVASAEVSGCMDPNAENYDDHATIQEYDQWGGILCSFADCTKVPAAGCIVGDLYLLASNYSEDFPIVCIHSLGGTYCVPGCMDPNANNYNPDANVDDGSCLFTQSQLDAAVAAAIGTVQASDFSRGDLEAAYRASYCGS